ncbi:hypothetical protein EP331_00805 [bacterium]|nr:MAG: hypothetical protein EP331_00805 [bacterium]
MTFPWIINKKTDLIWFIGGALSGYLLLFLNAGLSWDMISIWFIWVTLVDTPHFFGTYSRTFLDKEEFSKRKKLLLGSTGWFFLGPLTLLLSYFLYEAGVDNYVLPWTIFAAFFGLWAYWHVVRQHYGFLALYKKKMGEKSSFDFKLDSTMLYGGLLTPFVVFVTRHPETKGLVMINDSNAYISDWIASAAFGLIVLLSLVYIGRQVYLKTQGEQINGAKMLFLLAVVPLHVFICYSDAVLATGFFAFGAFVTVFHDLQYHAIVWFHHKNRYHKPGVDASRFGVAAKISKNLAVFICCAIFMGVLVRLLGCSIEVHPGCFPFYISSEKMLFADMGADKLFQGVLIGFALQHYFLDQFIWRTSKDKELNKDLKLAEK